MRRLIRLSAILLCGAVLACHSPRERSYRVLGGTVTGLKGSGLVLKNKDETLPIGKAGAFKFKTRVRESDAYAVTVVMPPAHPSQDCTVTGASGTMPDANVLTVEIDCVTKNFSVGGTVTGLKGTLVLAGSETNTVTIEADGAFALPQAFEDGTPYTVSVTTQPADQACAVTSEAGTVDGANVTSVAVACADISFPVIGTLKGASAPVELELNGVAMMVADNGPFTFPAKLKTGEEYGVTVSMSPAHQKCVVSHESGTIGMQPVTDVVVQCARWYEFGPFPAATFVLGQADFVSTDANRGGDPEANTLNSSRGNMVVAGGHFWMSDSTNNRVLGFATAPQTHGEGAVVVLGQPDFAHNTEGTTRSVFKGPRTIVTDGTRLFVDEYRNARVLIYDTIPTDSSALPDHVVGKPDFESTDKSCARGTFGGSESVFVSGGKLFVADSDHNRVLIWNQIPTTDGALPDLVLGQTGFETCAVNDANGDNKTDDTPSAATMSHPTDIWTDGEKLIVVDSANNRLLIWNTMPAQNGQAADVVVGQAGMISGSSGLAADQLAEPRFMVSTGLQIFVADNINNRVVIWNSMPTQNGKAADAVIGQPDFVSNVENNDGTGNSAASAKGLHSPSGFMLQDGRLWVLESDNNRLVAFDSTY